MKAKKLSSLKLLIVMSIFLTISGFSGCSRSKTLLYQNNQNEILRAYTDCSQSTILIKNGESPKWIPGTKTHFAYFERKQGTQNVKLWVAKEDGTNPIPLTDFEVFYDFAWSPDGEWLLVSNTKDGNYEVYKIKKDGSSSIRLTNDLYADQFSRWRPGHKEIAFVSNRGGFLHKALYISSSESIETPKTLTPLNIDVISDYYSRPCWSSDGNYIAFIARSGTAYDVFTVDVNTLNIQNITKNPGVYKHIHCYDIYIFYFNNNTLYRYNTKINKVEPSQGLGSYPGEGTLSPLSVDGAYVYFSIGQVGSKPGDIYAVQHYTGVSQMVGAGINPNVW